MTSRRKRRQQDGFMKKVSSLFNLDTVSKNSKVLKETFFLKIIWYDIFVNCNWVDTRWQ